MKNHNKKNIFSSPANKDIPLFKVFMPKTILKPIKDVLFSGYVGEGPQVAAFEEKLSRWFNNQNVLALNNGTSALQLALRLAGVGYRDEVISTPMTCVATNEPILAIGAKIVWADIDPWDANIDPDDVEKKITQKTKAIICVHWGGYPCDLERLNEIAGKYNVKLIEDACHAFGASYENRPIGSWSDFTCFSFQAIKQITTIDGGALVCKSSSDHARGKLLRWYGIDRQDKGKDMRCETDIFEYGYKLHMNDVTAAMGLEQLKYVEDIISKHREHAAFYNETFKDLKNVHLLKYKNDRISSFWLYSLRVKNRPRFIEYMNGLGIAASQVHVRNDNHTVFRDFKIKLPGVDEFAEEQVSIPVGWWLNKKDLDRIVRAVSGYDRIIS